VSRTVVVTGGAKGVGLACVRRFAALGDDVIALVRTPEGLGLLADEPARAELCDVTDEEAVVATFGQLGDVDILVNNAGNAISAPLHKTTLADWNAHLAVNATGPFLCTRAVLGGMRRRGSGTIITVASVAGRVGVPYTAAYTASKHAAVGLMRAVAAEVAGTGVRANAVCPTFIRTPLTDRAVGRIVELTGRSAEETERELAAMSPLGRLLEPDEVADSVVYLASNAAASINGQALVLDGGGVQK
jgi:NAD(P)-dependent dehydrogenase (short-subunit alcohol dehydrogenase family)